MFFSESPCVKSLWARIASTHQSSQVSIMDEVLLENDMREQQLVEDRNDIDTIWTGNLSSDVNGRESVDSSEQALYVNIGTQRAWNTTMTSPEYRVLRHTLLRIIVMRAMARQAGTTPIVFESKTVALGNDIVFKCAENGEACLVRITTSGASKAQTKAVKRRLHPLDVISETAT